MITLTEEDRASFAHWRIGRKPAEEWLAGNPPAESANAVLVKMLDRCGMDMPFVRLLADYLGVDPVAVYAENWPRKAAKVATEARARGDHPHADALHAALVALMYCANCGRPLEDPVSIGRGIGPDCWERIDPAWRSAIESRLVAA